MPLAPKLPSPEPVPGPIIAMRVLLVLHALALVFLGTPLFLVMVALTAMVGGTGADVLQLLVVVGLFVGPSIALNLLAAIHVARRPARARPYLGVAAVFALLHLLAGIWHTVVSGGFGLVAVVIPGGLSIAWMCLALRASLWISEAPREGRSMRAVGVDLGIAVLSLVVTVALALAVVWFQFERPRLVSAGFDESVAWQKAEDAVAEVVPAFPEFEGFAERRVRANPCSDDFAGGGEYLFYSVTYYFGESVQGSDARRAEYVAAAQEFWEDRGYSTERDEHGPSGAFWVEAENDEGLTLSVRTGGERESNPPALSARTECVKGVEDPPCLEPQGGVPPALDELSGIRCPAK